MGFSYEVNREECGVSPKGFLKKLLDMPYRRLQQAIRQEKILVNNQAIPEKYVLKEGDVLHASEPDITIRQKKETEGEEQQDLHCPVLFENEDFLVLNKAPGIVVQGAQGHDTSLNLHLRFLEHQRGIESATFHQVHRLDKETSGVLIIGKHQKSIRELNRLIREQKVTKTYLTLVVGTIEEPGTISKGLERAPEGAKEKVTISDRGKACVTHYSPIKHFTSDELDFTLLEVVIETGFMHQIRAHLKWLGFPITGDSMYAHLFANRKLESVLKRQFLHASSITFTYQDEEFSIEAELPEDLASCLDTLEVVPK